MSVAEVLRTSFEEYVKASDEAHRVFRGYQWGEFSAIAVDRANQLEANARLTHLAAIAAIEVPA